MYRQSAEIVGKEIEKLPVATPSAIVDLAAPDESPLHELFTWEDSEAARLYREVEARKIVRSLVTVKVTSQEIIPTRAFVSVVDVGNPGNRKYVALDHALQYKGYHLQLLLDAKKDLERFSVKYANLLKISKNFSTELITLQVAIDNLITEREKINK
jgi:hypothetical protein